MFSLRKKFATIIPFVLLALLGVGLLASVSITRQQQNLKSNAARNTTCSAIPQTPDTTTQPEKNVEEQTNELVQKSKDIQRFSFSAQKDAAFEVREIAQKRKEEMVRLMRRNPNKALEAILPRQEEVQIAAITKDCVEAEITTEGTLSIIHIDYNDNRASDVYTLKTSDNKIYNVFPAGDKRILRNDMKVRTSGYVLDNNLLVDTDDTSSITVLTNGVSSDIAASLGQQDVGIVLAYFSNTPKPSVPSSTMQSTFFTDVNNYYKDVSYNKTSVAGQMTPDWIQLQMQQSCDVNAIVGPALNAAGGSIDLSQYSRFIIYAPFGSSCGWNGAGIIGKNGQLSINGQSKKVSISWINMTQYTGSQSWITRVVAHEFGHNLNMHHACISPCDASTTQVEYGDPFTVMGKNFYGGGDQIVEINAPHRDYIGWFSGGNVQTVTSNGSFKLQPIEGSSNGLKAIKIPRGSGDFLYVEYRQPIGIDTNIANITGANLFDGAFLHTIVSFNQPPSIKSKLVDTTPQSPIPNSAIPVGSSYTDSESGATITVSSKTASELSIDVNFGGTGPTNTPTPSGGPTQGGPTASPTPTPSGGPTQGGPTASPTPTISGGVTTTPPQGDNIRLTYTIGLHGIGTGGDNRNPSASGTQNPLTKQRLLAIMVFDNEDNYITETLTNITYNASIGKYTGSIDVSKLPSANYTIRVMSSGYLTKQLPGIYTLQSNTTFPTVNLTTGDINEDDALDILDYNELIVCYSGVVAAPDCTGIGQRERADINNDGRVNQSDYNLFLRELQTINGV